jgi:hypothetical protein
MWREHESEVRSGRYECAAFRREEDVILWIDHKQDLLACRIFEYIARAFNEDSVALDD